MFDFLGSELTLLIALTPLRPCTGPRTRQRLRAGTLPAQLLFVHARELFAHSIELVTYLWGEIGNKAFVDGLAFIDGVEDLFLGHIDGR